VVKPAASRTDVEELYRLHAGELHGYLHRRAGQAGADLLGEVFVVALQRLSDLPEPELRRAWLFGTARRLLLAAERKTRKRQDAETERARFHEPAADTWDVDRLQRVRRVRDALASLREPDQDLIRLTEWERLQITEAAVVLGLRPGTARVRLYRARRALAAHPSLQAVLEPPTDPQTQPARAAQAISGNGHSGA
jgi:RNA polymerase sigma-70 factor (ECF subfamily)